MVKLKLNAIKWGSAIQSSTTVQKKTEAKPVDSSVQVMQTESISSIKKENIQESIEQKPETKKSSKISLGSIKKSSQNKDDSKGEEKKTEVKIKPKVEVFPVGASCELTNVELFPAYTSKFKKKQWWLLQEIKKLKRIPRTNKFFISVLVWSTIAGISMLFIVAPETHNLNNYKTSLLESYNKLSVKKTIDTEVIPEKNTPDPVIIDTPVPEVDITEEETVIESEQITDINKIYTGSTKWETETQEEYYSRIKQQILDKNLDK